MEDWKLERIYIWLRVASIIEPERNVKFFVDKEDKLLFNLIQKNDEWSMVLNYEIEVNYSEEDILILKEKMEHVKKGKSRIIEIPKLAQSHIDEIEKTKLDYKSGNKNGMDIWEHEKIVYGNPTDFVTNWLSGIGIIVEDTKLIG
ncbi:hypothetical protein ATE84_2338 [Aquimarina sp. MAR_2010_214]|uniref:hypothetical protein n=1 Tax=Aquimarina sp. MAR_2010_214 TaxID=1250026 RepID=UPI000C70E3C4|nr:hypothetical protein [Aquimarina sp. MAR_2010_214]PKV50283.1 hypothetical protein ATE84_2338 [Aquimarina sp. MAR_2010_214]